MKKPTILIIFFITFSLTSGCVTTTYSPVLLPTTEISSEGKLESLYPCLPKNTSGEIATFHRLIDGDTIEIEINGLIERVRYIGIDTPERNENFFSEASAFNLDLVEDQTLLLIKDVSERDQFGRLLRYVFTDQNTFVNFELVRQGFAVSSTYPPDVACSIFLLEAQISARENGLGIWEDGSFNSGSEGTNSVSELGIIIDYVNYDGQNSPESDEFVVIKNNGSSVIDLTNWKLNAGAPGQDFVFPMINLGPGDSCRIYTNEIHIETCGLSFGVEESIWANKGDCGYLYQPDGTLAHSYCYD